MLFAVCSVIIIFMILVFTHEFGHLFAAKFNNVNCPEFSVGMGPKLFSIKVNKTAYNFRLFPIGGYVRMAGDDETYYLVERDMYIVVKDEKILSIEENEVLNSSYVTIKSIDYIHRKITYSINDKICSLLLHEDAFVMLKSKKKIYISPYNSMLASKKPLQKSAILLAGPFANIAMALIILLSVNLIHGVPSSDAVIGTVNSDTSVLKPGDQIISVNDNRIENWNELRLILNFRSEKNQEIAIRRGEEYLNVQVEDSIMLSPMISRNIGSVLTATYQDTLHYSTILIKGLRDILTGEESLKNLSGPAGVMKQTYDIANTSTFHNLIIWASIMNLNVAIFNLLPIPALDGGRLLVIIIGVIRRKQIAPEKEGLIHLVGFTFMIGLTILATWNDLVKFFH
ncbi:MULTISPECIES: RIP metalloprotease RseP [Paenibacillus]|uniref:RIP metalloprotease RseP n=1 Tax=Paenibacillus TaxID=44249 RepID=UPI0009A7FAB8|nr:MULTISPECIES: RIP metalloprotease RseP [Paenibacillus]MCZ1268249.1 RIP metalloprotease RseP [Paenibacillus tundrae]SLK15784.1 regulator of sigma E protease [Paenibacillus sp. RU5A]SOC74070.1 regulator of sigma E protease [Paenibacillus sp. RU26A]SOC76245.1 regulator of sigma E protease [Paenibacillus sp. RU5M]